MVTDNKKTTSGVPTSTPFSARTRTQLVKPTQSGNFGLTTRGKQITTGNPTINNSMTSNGYYFKTNPLLKRTDGGANPVVTGSSSATPAQTQAADQARYGYKTDYTDANGDALYSNPGFLGEGAMATKSNFDQAREMIGKLSDDEILTLLNELADGSLRGYESTQTGDPSTLTDDVTTPAQAKSSTTSLGDLLAQRGGAQ